MTKKKRIFIALLSFLLTFMQVAGYYISAKFNTTVHSFWVRIVDQNSSKWIYVIWFLVELLLFYLLFFKWFSYLEKAEEKTHQKERSAPKALEKLTNSPMGYVLIMLLLLLCWIPWLLASYPGFFNYDVSGQLPQVMYDTSPYVNHHPLLHTLIVGNIITFFYQISGENLQTGILAYSLFQMIFCSAFFTYFIFFLKKIGAKFYFQLGAFLYYALFPTIILFALSTTKDVMCLAVFQLAVLKIYESFYVGFDVFFRRKSNIFCLILSLTFSCLLRKNVIYAVLLILIFALLFLRKKGICFSVSLICVVILYLIIERALVFSLDAREGGVREAFSVPMQQIAKTYNQYGSSSLTSEEKQAILAVIDGENLADYNPVLADPIKSHVNFDIVLQNKWKYFDLWLSLGLKYPDAYVTAFGDNTYQAWYPGTSIIEDVSKHHIYYFDCDMSLEIERSSKFPMLLDFIKKISNGEVYQKVPGIRLLYSIGAMMWLVIIGLFYGLYSKRPEYLWAGIAVLAICFTNFLGPVSLVRYYLVLYYGFPFWAALLFPKSKSK